MSSSCLEGVRDELQDVSVLLATGFNDGQHHFHEAVSAFILGAEAEAAPDHTGQCIRRPAYAARRGCSGVSLTAGSGVRPKRLASIRCNLLRLKVFMKSIRPGANRFS